MRFPHLLRRPDDGAGATPPTATPPTATPPTATPTAPATPPTAPAAPATGSTPAPGADLPAHLKALPEHLRGGNDVETIAKLTAAYEGSRKALSERGAVPDAPEAYLAAYKPDEKLAGFVDTLKEDALFKQLGDVAKAAQMTEKQFDTFVNKTLVALVETGQMPAPVDPQAVLAALTPKDGLPAEATQRAHAEIAADFAFVDGLKTNPPPGFDADVASALEEALGTIGGHKLVRMLRAQGAETTPALGGTTAAPISKEAFQARARDERGRVGSAKYDAAFAAETTRLAKLLYPDQPGA